MLKKIYVFLTIATIAANAITITELFDSLSKQPSVQKDVMNIMNANIDKKLAKDALYPKLYGSLSYEHFNRPSSLRPFLPTETTSLLANNEPLPFSKDITKVGFSFDFPLFVKSLYTIKDKASILKSAAIDKKKLNFIQKEATILGANANLQYLENLLKALDAKKKSILKTREDVAIKVNNGRAAGVSLLKIDESLNSIETTKNSILSKINELKSLIYTISGVEIDKSVKMKKTEDIKKGELFALLPMKAALKAKKLGIKASKESLYPSLFLKAGYSKSYAKGYNNDKSIDTGFGSIGLYLNIPLFDKTKRTKIQKAKIAYEKEMLSIADTKHSLIVKAKKLEKDMAILKRSEDLAQKSIKINQELLKVARISYKNGRMSEEEYLRYENALFNSFASLYEVKAKVWQDIAELAVIYGNDLKEIVR
ncbi:MAG: TolC family protein [Epsilonproteobacteria bacterium]|nr:TolC family protein [Campylobacterota bacterium]